MHIPALIRDLAIIMSVAGLVTLVFQRIRQPVVLGYLVAGIVVGPHTPPFPLVSDLPNIKILAELGVIFLMFSLGLEFSFRKLMRVGGSAAFTAVFEVLFMSVLGFVSGRLMGWKLMDSLFLGAILSISSTTIIIKALDELGLKTRRFAEVIFGILIVEDLVAILILVGLTSVATAGSFSGMVMLSSAARLALVVGSWFLTGYFAVPRFIRYVGRFGSDEMLTVVSVGLCLSLAAFAAYFNYSVALGAFIMGSILAESTESQRIEELIRPLRDLFAAIFFVSVGMLIDPLAIWQHKGAVLGIAAITIAGKIVSTAFGSLLTGQSLKTSVQVGFGLAQIGEFSFIIATLGLTLGVMSDFLYPVAVAVSLVTTFTTPYLIRISHTFAKALEARLPRRLLRGIIVYSGWVEKQSARSTPDPELRRFLLRWILNAFLVILITVLTASIGIPFVKQRFGDHPGIVTLGWAMAFLSASPFLWAMSSALLSSWAGKGPLYRKLGATYSWFEEGFTEVFRNSSKTERRGDMFRRLAPWDGHLVRLKVHADSAITGKTLQESSLRNSHGLNVVAIQRGSRTIVAPVPTQQIFPKDELLVLGTDEKIDAARPMIEKSDRPAAFTESLVGYELRRISIGETSKFLGKSIRQSGIREDFGAMVVGIERQGRRIMNPESDMELEMEDILLIVGASEHLEEMLRKLSAGA